MVYANRLMALAMIRYDLRFTFHLGVTEAGEGEDGRIRSAIGIGTLLLDGIGDTIRVSLTEDPEEEIPFTRVLIRYVEHQRTFLQRIQSNHIPLSFFSYKKRESDQIGPIGGHRPPFFICQEWESSRLTAKTDPPDLVFSGSAGLEWIPMRPVPKNLAADGRRFEIIHNIHPGKNDSSVIPLLRVDLMNEDPDLFAALKNFPDIILVPSSPSEGWIFHIRRFIFRLMEEGIRCPVIPVKYYHLRDDETFRAMIACDFGPLFVDGLVDGMMIGSEKNFPESERMIPAAWSVMQATGARISRAEFISCPSCGRTHFHLQQITSLIKEKTGHLKGVRIAVMGCIVNGPGEMADADYGYVGSQKGKITLYRKDVPVEKNIPASLAVETLISLLKQDGVWIDPA
jgi:(E)-4-hydroxy-3-methylbut-2-enyl-diphosphate synthase